MGGLGSGNFDERWDRKTTVEECRRQLDADELAREGLFQIGVEGVSYWFDPETDEVRSSVGFSTSLGSDGERVFQISYRWDDSEDVCIPIRLQTTKPHFGGLRYWFTCPLITDGVVCRRRVRKLYVPPGGKYFGCRICHDLTYPRRESLKQMAERAARLEARLARRLGFG